MNSIIFIEENKQISTNNKRVSFSFFFFSIFIITLLVILYVVSHIILMKLGYQSINLEQKRDELLAQKYQLESTVENLSSLTRIEKIAIQKLGMRRAEKIEFVAMVPNNINVALAANQAKEPEQKSSFLEAGVFFKKFGNLQIFPNH